MKTYDLGDMTREKLQVLEHNDGSVHAKYSPSKLKSIILCPGSKKYIDRPSSGSSYASAGTWLHHLVPLLANTAPGVDWSTVDRINCIPPLEEDESDAVMLLCWKYRSSAQTMSMTPSTCGLSSLCRHLTPMSSAQQISSYTISLIVPWSIGSSARV